MKVTILAKLQVTHEWLSIKMTFHILYLSDLFMDRSLKGVREKYVCFKEIIHIDRP